jgi:hypothetical protein
VRSSSRQLTTAATTAAALVVLCVFLQKRSPTVPPDFQFQSHFSRQQAALIFAKTRQELRQIYWSGICGNLKHLQFDQAWHRFKNGQGHIDGVLTNANADVVACVRFKNGDSYWLTVEAVGKRDVARAKLH